MSKPRAAQIPPFRAAPLSSCEPRRSHEMWTKITRKKYGREKLRFASDTTDVEWSVIQPLLLLPNKRGAICGRLPARFSVAAIEPS